MRHLSKFIGLAAVVLAGCAKISPEVSLQPMTFSASVSDEPGVKAAIDGLDIKWSAGDEIGIYDGTAVRKFTLKEGADKTSAVFEGKAAKADSYIAVYPYSENLSVAGGKVNGLSVPYIQTAGACPVIMTAKCEDGGNAFAFKNALAYVKVTPEFDCHKIVLEAHEKNWLCGDSELVAGISDSALYADVVRNSSSHAILNGEIKAGNSYYIAVCPINLYDGFCITFDPLEDKLQYVLMRGTNKDGSRVKLVRGHVLNLGQFIIDMTNWSERTEYLAPYGPYDPVMEESQDYRAVYDWKDVTRIAAQIHKTGDKRQLKIHFRNDIDFGGRTLNTMKLESDRFVNIDGDGYKIFNYQQGSVDDGGDRYAGLFYVKKLWGLTFHSLTLCPGKFDLSHDDDIYGGAFVAKGFFTDRICFDNCNVEGNIKVSCTGTTSEAYAGGFCGKIECEGGDKLPQDQPSVSVWNCLMDGSVTAYSEDDMAYAGGFIGLLETPEKSFDCNVVRCRNRAAILAQGDDDYNPIGFGQGGISAGGMVGCDRDFLSGGNMVLMVNSCVNEGSVKAEAMDNDNSFAGGMVGCQDSDGKDNAHPAVYNCLNRGSITVKGGTGWGGAMAGLASGMIGYCYTDRTVFSNCVDDGKLSSDDICAHISGNIGTYDSDTDYPCYWTTDDSLPGIHDKWDAGAYSSGNECGRKTDLQASDMKTDFYRDYVKWITRDGHLDIDIVY